MVIFWSEVARLPRVSQEKVSEGALIVSKSF